MSGQSSDRAQLKRASLSAGELYMVRRQAAVVLVCIAGIVESASAIPREVPNVVLIVADDVGVDLVSGYKEGANPACTPEIDALASQGLLFRNAWANPRCSPTRAQILTGLHAFRNGVGEIIPGSGEVLGLSTEFVSLPQALSVYDSSAVGKWHLGAEAQGFDHPLRVGFAYYAGSMYNLNRGFAGADYFTWLKNVNGVAIVQSVYATTDTVDDAIARAASMQPPWFLYVAFNAPHTPLHEPPADLCQSGICEQHFCPPGESPAEQTKAMLEALDTELGRLVTEIRAVDPSAYFIFVGDNGTTERATEPPFDPLHAKKTVYEGGVNVPMIVTGPGVRVGESNALVSAVDLFATVLELAGEEYSTPDSVSFTSVLWDPNAPEPRSTVYAEEFVPNFDPTTEEFAPISHDRAVRNVRYKLVRKSQAGVTLLEFYDLLSDPFEQVNLAPPSTPEQKENFRALNERLVQLGVACAADFDLDGAVSLSDLAVLLAHFDESMPSDGQGDANRDGLVDLTDLAMLLREFESGC